MSMTMSTPSRTLLHLHLACRDLQRSPRGSVTRCTAAKTPYNGFNVIPLLSVDVNVIELDSYRTFLGIDESIITFSSPIFQKKSKILFLSNCKEPTTWRVTTESRRKPRAVEVAETYCPT